MSGKYTLFHAEACSSTVIEAAFKVLLQPDQFEIIELDYEETTHTKSNAADPNVQHMKAANPLLQFPTVITPEGAVMTEVVAIVFYLLEAHGTNTPWSPASLTPIQRAKFYRWMLFIPNQLYPMISLLDFPERFMRVPDDAPVTQETAKTWIIDTVTARRKDIYGLLETDLVKATAREPGQFVLGTVQPTFLDVYLTLVVHYTPRPRPEWIIENCPELIALVRQTLQVPILREVFKRNDLDFFL